MSKKEGSSLVLLGWRTHDWSRETDVKISIPTLKSTGRPLKGALKMRVF
jgi:hypothetical protein